jgi:hypothetical protein
MGACDGATGAAGGASLHRRVHIGGRWVVTSPARDNHWMFSGLLATAYPSIQVDSNLLFARDGNIYSSGGITAAIREIALATARTMVVIPSRPRGNPNSVPM